MSSQQRNNFAGSGVLALVFFLGIIATILSILFFDEYFSDLWQDRAFAGAVTVVAYPILALPEGRRDLHRYLRDLEGTVIDALGCTYTQTVIVEDGFIFTLEIGPDIELEYGDSIQLMAEISIPWSLVDSRAEINTQVPCMATATPNHHSRRGWRRSQA